MSGMPRPEGLDKLQSKSRSDQVTEANTLVEALIFVAEATGAELRVQGAHEHCMALRVFILIFAIRYADRLRDAWLFDDVEQPGEIPVFPSRRSAAGAVENVGGRVRHGLSVLDVDVRLDAGFSWVVPSAVDRYDGVGRVGRVRAVSEHERGEVRRARIVPKISHNPEFILVSGGRSVGGRAI